MANPLNFSALNNDESNEVGYRKGEYTLTDNKVRVNFIDGSESVLFEDISSISYRTIKSPNWKIVGIWFGVVCVSAIFAALIYERIILEGQFVYFLISLLGLLFGFIMMFLTKDINLCDNVFIETKGGKQIVFSVECGFGAEKMEQIENDRRNFQEDN